MQSMTGPALICAALLVLAGLPKIARPAPTATALRAVGATFTTRAQVRVLAVGEVAVGAVALAYGSIAIDAALALVYTGFSVFLVLALRPSAGRVSCGCTGRADTPPTRSHLVLTLTLAALAALAALLGGHTGLAQADWTGDGAEVALVVGFAVIGTWFGWLVLTLLPGVRVLRPVRAND